MAQLTPDEEAALADHLTSCAASRAEADSLLHVTALTLGADTGRAPVEDADPPPADLGDRILSRVARERRARRMARLGVAMSAAAAAVVVAVVLTDDAGQPPLRGEPVSFVHQAQGVDASGVLAAADHGGSVLELTASGLDPDTTYAVWLTPPGGSYEDRIPAGTFRPDDDGEIDARLSCSLAPERMGRAWVTTPDGEIALDTEPAEE
jgi:hypothetical protein